MLDPVSILLSSSRFPHYHYASNNRIKQIHYFLLGLPAIMRVQHKKNYDIGLFVTYPDHVLVGLGMHLRARVDLSHLVRFVYFNIPPLDLLTIMLFIKSPVLLPLVLNLRRLYAKDDAIYNKRSFAPTGSFGIKNNIHAVGGTCGRISDPSGWLNNGESPFIAINDQPIRPHCRNIQGYEETQEYANSC
jgi:hypothetical protein